MSDIIERLKGPRTSQGGLWPYPNLHDEAAAEITRLREENARLREALKPFSSLFLYPDDLGVEHAEDIRSDPDWDDVANGVQSENVFVLRRDIRRARAAVREESGVRSDV